MKSITFITSGESHGKALIGIIEGIPAGFPISASDINYDLARRQKGYGRGGRMKIESDSAEILSGIRWGLTLGSPIAIKIENSDWANWLKGMSEYACDEGSLPAVTRPRPGHADLAGAIKYNTQDVRNILERSSARETAMRVALGSIAKKVLSEFGINIGSYVFRIGGAELKIANPPSTKKNLLALFRAAERSQVRCPDRNTSIEMISAIDKAVKGGYSLGGDFTVFAAGLPPGLGSHIQWDRRLDGQLAQALMSIQAIKGVEIGSGFALAEKPGSDVMDEIYYNKSSDVSSLPFFRKTNHSGGIEGGMTNGMPVIISAVMKPIPTLRRPLRSVDIISKRTIKAAYERSDVCAVPAASVVGEAMASLILADVFFEKFGGDSRQETARNYNSYMQQIRKF